MMSETFESYLKYDSMSINELEAEREELLVAISNERLWQKGFFDSESIEMHEDNINSLIDELDYVNTKISHESAEKVDLDSQIKSASDRTKKSFSQSNSIEFHR